MALTFMRQARPKDLNSVLTIINNGKQFLKLQQINQWQAGYPNENTISQDIDDGVGFVFTIDKKVAGYAALVYGEDSGYTHIVEGKWDNPDFNYFAIHRIAISDEYRGQNLSGKFFTAIITYIFSQNGRDIRIDTHPKNKVMQSVIKSNGFIKKGIVHVDESNDETERYAYQLSL